MTSNKATFFFVVAAFVYAWLLMFLSGFYALGRFPIIEDFAHFDSVHYLSIATRGYELFPCTPDIGIEGTWCGNAAWQPLYPLTMFIVTFLTGISIELSGILVTALFGFLLLFVISKDLPAHKNWVWTLVVLLTASVFPGATWTHAIFPMSMVLFFGYLAVQGAYKKRSPYIIGTFVTLAILSHSSGFVIAVATLIVFVFSTPRLTPVKLLKVSLPIFLGIAAWLLSLALMTGNIQAWWLVQQKYYLEGQDLLTKLGSPILHLLEIRDLSNFAVFWPSVQTWLVIAIIFTYIFNTLKFEKEKILVLRELLVLGMLGLFPFLLGGQLSVSRNESPIIAAKPFMPVNSWIYGVFFALLSITYFFISAVFFQNGIA